MHRRPEWHIYSGQVDRMHSQLDAADLSPRAVRRPTGPRSSRRDADRTVRREAGFSLLETVMALALTLLVLGALFELARPAASLNRSLPETANVQQRLRHAFDRLHTDLLAAGRGTVSWSRPGRSGGSCRPWCPIGSDFEPLPGSIDARGPRRSRHCPCPGRPAPRPRS